MIAHIAEEELREEAVPPLMSQVDWMLAGTMRDDENWIEDVDDESADPFSTGYNGLETLTWPLEMKF